jgi:antiphage defense system Thoeris ThsB-like protein
VRLAIERNDSALRLWSLFDFNAAIETVRARIKATDMVIVICGEKTHTATGVDVELKITQEEKKPYFLLTGYTNKTCTRPLSAKASDKLYNWTWANLKSLVNGNR